MSDPKARCFDVAGSRSGGFAFEREPQERRLRNHLVTLAVTALAVLAAGPAGAGESSEGAEVRAVTNASALRTFVNLRVGLSTTAARPELCLEVTPVAPVSLEACGTGSGFLHHDADPELAHFRANLRLGALEAGLGRFELRLGIGFAELQVGPDDPGFQFTGVGPRGVETAGPELGGSLRALAPFWGGVALVGSLGVGVAWLPHAPRLVYPQPEFLPFCALSLGVGF